MHTRCSDAETLEQEDKPMNRLRLSILCAGIVAALGVTTYLVAADDEHSHKSHVGAAKVDSGPLSNATVSFGAWTSTPPHDRFPNVSNTRLFNQHVLIPEVAKIKAGGAVNFIIAGFHQVIVYDDGTQPGDIDTNITDPLTNPLPPPSPLLIADSDRRIYRGLDPSTQGPDRVEVVHFAQPGTYLVICGVLPHFNVGMYGYVQVIP